MELFSVGFEPLMEEAIVYRIMTAAADAGWWVHKLSSILLKAPQLASPPSAWNHLLVHFSSASSKRWSTQLARNLASDSLSANGFAVSVHRCVASEEAAVSAASFSARQAVATPGGCASSQSKCLSCAGTQEQEQPGGSVLQSVSIWV